MMYILTTKHMVLFNSSYDFNISLIPNLTSILQEENYKPVSDEHRHKNTKQSISKSSVVRKR